MPVIWCAVLLLIGSVLGDGRLGVPERGDFVVNVTGVLPGQATLFVLEPGLKQYATLAVSGYSGSDSSFMTAAPTLMYDDNAEEVELELTSCLTGQCCRQVEGTVAWYTVNPDLYPRSLHIELDDSTPSSVSLSWEPASDVSGYVVAYQEAGGDALDFMPDFSQSPFNQNSLPSPSSGIVVLETTEPSVTLEGLTEFSAYLVSVWGVAETEFVMYRQRYVFAVYKNAYRFPADTEPSSRGGNAGLALALFAISTTIVTAVGTFLSRDHAWASTCQNGTFDRHGKYTQVWKMILFLWALMFIAFALVLLDFFWDGQRPPYVYTIGQATGLGQTTVCNTDSECGSASVTTMEWEGVDGLVKTGSVRGKKYADTACVLRYIRVEGGDRIKLEWGTPKAVLPVIGCLLGWGGLVLGYLVTSAFDPCGGKTSLSKVDPTQTRAAKEAAHVPSNDGGSWSGS